MVRGRFTVGTTFLLGLAAVVTMALSSVELDNLRISSAQFSQDLFTVLREGKENENLVASPISLQIALAMLLAGAKENSKTQLSTVLHVGTEDLQTYLNAYKELLESIKDPVLNVASTVFVDSAIKLLDTYTTAVSTGIGANVQQVDFATAPDAAAKTINDWCSTNTNGKITDLFTADDLQSASVVLANAVHFKALWKKKFDVQYTRERDFKSPTGVVKVQMMFNSDHYNYAYSEQLKAEVLELPYASDKFRMLVILPNEGVALKDVDSSLKATGLDTIIKGMTSTKLDVYIPRFKVEMTINLNDPLVKLGAADIFDQGKCNLTGISAAPLFVSQVKQKVFIEVNEEGTEAAAVTAARIQKRSLSFPEKFEADHPFIFILISTKKPHGVAFFGAVLDPKTNSGTHDEL
ncbi:hypothetical protein GE061_015585 [Apolygus lucorum]|uniref:Serpin domain-containing protein n=1 Tax=Apolygus lucorum TaxID=248454 RepID=A0A8S9XLK2_APOLU|nr:hypothetical protein GE061_015585 [Apolygus lucorum]